MIMLINKCLIVILAQLIATVPLRRNLTSECERLAALAISHASIICPRAQVHASSALPTRESILASVLEAILPCVLASTLKQTRYYSQTNSRLLTNKLASICKRACEYSQANMGVLRYRFPRALVDLVLPSTSCFSKVQMQTN